MRLGGIGKETNTLLFYATCRKSRRVAKAYGCKLGFETVTD